MKEFELLQKEFPNAGVTIHFDKKVADMPTIELDGSSVKAVCKFLRDHDTYNYEQLMDVCGVDYLAYGKTEWQTSDVATSTGFSRGVDSSLPLETTELATKHRFAVVYHLLSLKHNKRVRLKCFLPSDPPEIDSVCEIWSSANWFEREAFDLFGIIFKGHPDLRRILTDYGFVGHPFRKDFPLSGNVEVHYDETQKRVVYRPVTVEPRTLVPRVIRKDSRYVESSEG